MSYDENGREILLTGKPISGCDGRTLKPSGESPRDFVLCEIGTGKLITKQVYTYEEARQQTSADVGVRTVDELTWNDWDGWWCKQSPSEL